MKPADIVARVSEDLITRLEEARHTGQWRKPWSVSGGALPYNHLTGQRYHGINMLIFWLEAEAKGYERNGWLTFKQKETLAEQLGCELSVRGQKATHGIKQVQHAYRPWVQQEGRAVNMETGEIKDLRDPLFRKWVSFAVFNVQQIEGWPDGYWPEDSMFDEEIAYASAKIFFDRLPVRLIHAGDSAFYSPKEDKVVMPHPSRFADEAHYWSTLGHEMTHATMHESRCNRVVDLQNVEAYAFEELVAEFGSAFLNAELGIEGDMQHVEYIDGWIKHLRDDPHAAVRAVSQADAAFQWLLWHGEGTQEEVDAA